MVGEGVEEVRKASSWTDGGELVGVADEDEGGAAVVGELNEGGEEWGFDHAGFIDDEDAVGWEGVVLTVLQQVMQGLGGGMGALTEVFGGAALEGEGEDGSVLVLPQLTGDAEEGGFSGSRDSVEEAQVAVGLEELGEDVVLFWGEVLGLAVLFYLLGV